MTQSALYSQNIDKSNVLNIFSIKGVYMITGKMYVEDIVRQYPKAVNFLIDRDIICIRCGAPVWGTLNELLNEKHIEDTDALIRELNEFLGNE